MQAEDDVSSPEVMLTFYKRLYPFKSVFAWLNHSYVPTRLFLNREFAFTLPGDIYLRYNSFLTVEEFRRQVIRLLPSRFEIGAVYNARPRDKKTLRPGALQPQQRELVFDIDMTDYDEIRTCCTGKGICRRCWGFISIAVKILDNALRDHFGFRHILWVYSGRRGIHCWVSDLEAMQLTDEQRKSIMGWLEVIKGGWDTAKKVNVRVPKQPSLHPALQSAVEIAKNEFPKLILEDQNCFASEEQTAILLELLCDRSVSERLRKQWTIGLENSEEKWTDIRKIIKAQSKDGVDYSSIPLYRAMEDIILQYTYPRLDSEVTKHRNHLLKAPFCVHPATGRICVPVEPSRADEFDPEKVPTVGQLLRELDELGNKAADADVMTDVATVDDTAESTQQHQPHHSDWEQTSLKPYVDILDKHARGLMEECRLRQRKQEEISHDF